MKTASTGSNNLPIDKQGRTIQVSDNLSWVRGRHTFKTGFDLNIIHEVMINLYNGTGQYSYTGSAQTAFNNWVLDTYGINTGDGLTAHAGRPAPILRRRPCPLSD